MTKKDSIKSTNKMLNFIKVNEDEITDVRGFTIGSSDKDTIFFQIVVKLGGESKSFTFKLRASYNVKTKNKKFFTFELKDLPFLDNYEVDNQFSIENSSIDSTNKGLADRLGYYYGTY